MTDAQQARNDGFTVDTSCYPWVAYKGPRFNPAVFKYIRTDAECDAAAIAVTNISTADDLVLDAIITQEIASIDTSSSADNGASSDFSGGGGDFGGGGDSGSW